MTTYYDTLKIYGSCPVDCCLCRQACARKWEVESEEGRIKAVHCPEINFHSAMVCGQCSVPACLEICPAGAISKSLEDGIVRIDNEKCVGCGLCTLACPYGGIFYSKSLNKAYKCDLCGGEPQCVEACQPRALSFIRPRSIVANLPYDDILPRSNTMCPGCPAEIALRTAVKVLGENTIFVVSPGCAPVALAEIPLPLHICLFTASPATMEGMKRYYQRIGRDVNVVTFIGDGATADAGFQSLSGAAERGANVIYICYDNEAYMNTGIQRSSTTPTHAWTFTTPIGQQRRGKEQRAKYMPLIMAFHNIPYVATATVAYLDDYVAKLNKAVKVRDGMSYIHLLSPCPTGWRSPVASAIEQSRMAVETNYFPLWEAERGHFRFTYRPANHKPLREFTKLMGRFLHLTEEELRQLQAQTDDRVKLLELLVSGC